MAAGTEANQDLIMFASQYLLGGLTETFKSMNQVYNTNLFDKIPVTIDLQRSVELLFEEGTFTMKVQPKLNFAGLIDFQSQLTLKVSPQLQEGSAERIATVIPGLQVIQMEESVLTVYGVDISVNTLANLCTSVATALANQIVSDFPVAPIPQIPFYITGQNIQFKAGSMESELSVVFL